MKFEFEQKEIDLLFLKEKHPFHLVDNSLYPFLISIASFGLVFGTVCTIHTEIFSTLNEFFTQPLIRFA